MDAGLAGGGVDGGGLLEGVGVGEDPVRGSSSIGAEGGGAYRAFANALCSCSMAPHVHHQCGIYFTWSA